MITVVLIMTIIFLLLAVVTQDAISNMSLSRHTQDWNAALGSAQAGANDFIYRLNANEAYSYCIALKVQPVGPPDPANCIALPTPPATFPGWVAVPHSAAGARLACYTYSIPSNGLLAGSTGAGTSGGSAILLDVTGIVTTGSCTNTAIATRRIRMTITRITYLNYAYFTDVETQDPAQYDPTLSSEFIADPAALQDAYQYCSNYYFALSDDNTVALSNGAKPAGGFAKVQLTDKRSNHSSIGSYTSYTPNNICTYTKFGGDTFDGPVHTNDTFFLNSPTTFNDAVEVSHNGSETGTGPSPSCGLYAAPTVGNNYDQGNLWVDAGLASKTTAAPFSGQSFNPINCRSPIRLPATNPTLKQQAIKSGCLYQGLTYLYFERSGAIDVYSPSTPAGTAGINCPASGVKPNSSFNGVIYVQDLPTTFLPKCTLSTAAHNTAIGAVANLGAIIQDNDLNQLENDPTGQAGKNAKAYDCNNGDAFVGGNLSGQLTVGTDNNIMVYQNLTYADDTGPTGTTLSPTGSNVLGLEPVGNVQIYHPVQCLGWAAGNAVQPPYLGCYNAPTTTNILPITASCPAMTACQTNYVQAAVLAFKGEFTNENWAYGQSEGTINATGSVTERYRGRMAGTNTGSGYGKHYSYDVRLSFVTPPYFLPPDVFSWTATSFAETTTDTSN